MSDTDDLRSRSAKRLCVECDDPPSESQLSKRAPAGNAWSAERDFGIVIDAGSSGSRVQIYSWLRHDIARKQRERAGKPLNVLPKVEVGVEQGEGWHAKTTPGISTFGIDPAGVDEHLRPLMEHALSVIPKASVANTPIYLLATAGMRLLPEAERDAVLGRACRFIRNNYPFKIGDCSQTVRVITGEEEGLFGWVAVNYLMDGFDQHVHADDSGHASSSTYGFLDMGGASTQIAFEPSASERIKHADNLVAVHLRQLDGRDVAHPVFVTTWLGYGTNQARQRFVDEQVAADAQLPAAQDEKVSDAEQHLRIVDDPCLPQDLTLSEKRHPGVAFRGTGDFAMCVRRQSPLLNKDAPCSDEPCLFAGVHAPAIDFSVNHFIGISEYWYSTQELWSLGGVYDFVSFEKHAAAYCGRNWSELKKDHPEGVQQDRLELQCFKAAWIVNILHEGIGIPRYRIDAGGSGDPKAPLVAETAERKAGEKGLVKPTAGVGPQPSFQSLDTVGEVSVSWTLGKMVLEVSQSVQPGSQMPHAGEKSLQFPPGWRNRFTRTTSPVLAGSVVLFALLAWLLSSSKRRKWLLPTFLQRHGANAAGDYALVGLEEGGLEQTGPRSSFTLAGRMNGAATTPSPRLGGPSPRLGFPPSKQDPSRPRFLRHAFSTPANLGKRVPSSRDRHGRAISTDIEGLSAGMVNGKANSADSSDDDTSSRGSLSRVASQSTLNVNRGIRGRSATPSGSGVMYGEEA